MATSKSKVFLVSPANTTCMSDLELWLQHGYTSILQLVFAKLAPYDVSRLASCQENMH